MKVVNMKAVRAIKQAGLSLVELLVALTIGAILIWGATQVYVDSRNAYTGNENVSRMQETARYAMSVIESDLRLAGYWGLVRGTTSITGSATWNGTASAVTNPNSCGTNFAVDLATPVTGRNGDNATQLFTGGCNSLPDLDGNTWNAAPVLGADNLVIRRAGITEIAAAHNNQVQICSNRQSAVLFSNGDATVCPNSDPTTAPSGCTEAAPYTSCRARSLRNMEVYGYYIDQNSTGRTGVPSLRRKALCVGPGGAACAGNTLIDEEVIANVEDLQVQYGIAGGGAGAAATGVATRYVNAADVGANPIVAVRVWLLVRSDEPEAGYIDGQTYTYADRQTGTTSNLNSTANATKAYVPSLSTSTSFTDARRYRHLLVSRTVQLRDATGT
jgi:type IV pilus assembly protein PilW